MITRAIIVDKDLSIGKLKLEIPILWGVGGREHTQIWASILHTPGFNIDYRVGDVVEVGFEDNDVGKPVVIGFLQLRDRETDSRIYGVLKDLIVEEKLTAPDATTIGKSPYQEVFSTIEDCLNLKKDVAVLATESNATNDEIAGIQENLTELATKIETMGSYPFELLIDTTQATTTFFAGDQFNSNGIVVTLRYLNGTLKNVEKFEVIPPADMVNPGNKFAMVLGEGKVASYEIIVVPVMLVTLEVGGTYKTDYVVGQTFDPTGMIVTAVYNNGDKVDITSQVSISPEGALTVDDDTISISYEGMTTQIKITVNNNT